MQKLTNKVAVITGASQGIGRAIALAFAAVGLIHALAALRALLGRADLSAGWFRW